MLSFVGILCCYLGSAAQGRSSELRLKNPLREICTAGSVREETFVGAMADLNGHEAGNGGHSQVKPTAPRTLLYSERWRCFNSYILADRRLTACASSSATSRGRVPSSVRSRRAVKSRVKNQSAT